MHLLLYLAQSYWSAFNKNGYLMPAQFIADEKGPVEPNVYHILEFAQPVIETHQIDIEACRFLNNIWNKFAHHKINTMIDMVKKHPPFANAAEKGKAAVISITDMAMFYSGMPSETVKKTENKKPDISFKKKENIKEDVDNKKNPEIAEYMPSPNTPKLNEIAEKFGKRLMYNQSGMPVAVRKWSPAKASLKN